LLFGDAMDSLRHVHRRHRALFDLGQKVF